MSNRTDFRMYDYCSFCSLSVYILSFMRAKFDVFITYVPKKHKNPMFIMVRAVAQM